jgi:simple sugar transport system permease protein
VLKIPAELIATLPYVATVIGLIIYAVSETRKKNKKLKSPLAK